MKNNNDFLYAMGFVAAFAIAMATPAFAEKVISTTTTTQSVAPVAPVSETTTTTTTTEADGTVTKNVRVTKTVQPTTNVTTYTFGSSDRAMLRKYLLTEWPSTCKDGLLDYDGNCLSTGEYSKVKRTYVIGQPLPTTVDMLPLSAQLEAHMEPAPEGYFYTLLDRDVLLVNKSDNRVVDAVSYYAVE